MRAALTRHWPEYLMEAAGLGLFMVSACAFAVVIFHPVSPAASLLGGPLARRALMGLAMALTAIGLIYSPWGRRSGAHFNPAVTLTFFRLGKVDGWDAAFYIVAQFAGGVCGVLLMKTVALSLVADPSVHYVATVPGTSGVGVAFGAEMVIAFGLMLVVLIVSNTADLAPFTGLFAGALVAAYITLEAPLSGMSMNPARSFASALPADTWRAFWVYLTAPLAGMLLASEVYVHGARRRVICAKLQHDGGQRCIFRCGYMPTSNPGRLGGA